MGNGEQGNGKRQTRAVLWGHVELLWTYRGATSR